MSNVSIFEKKWLDLVFEGKNQKYGAYQLRRESTKTTLFSFIFGIFFLGLGTFLLSSFSGKTEPAPAPIPEEPVINVDVWHPQIDHPKTVQPQTKKETVKAPEDNKNYKVVTTEQATATVSKTAENPTPNGPTSPEGGTTGTSSEGSTVAKGPVVIAIPSNNSPVNKSDLDKQPVFPGGIQKFYEYVGRNFEKQEVEDEGQTIKVMVSFVIEKNGTMTDIEVIKKTNDIIDKEAVRVLKSLKTKWEPGYKEGQAVRTQYTLPISVMM